MANKEIKMEVVVYCDYLDREIILAKVKGTQLFQLFYRSAGLNDPNTKGSVFPIFGVCDPSFIFGNYLISLYEEIYEHAYDMCVGWIFKTSKDKTNMEAYWSQDAYKDLCMDLEVLDTKFFGTKVSYETMMNICTDILLNADDTHKFIAKAFKKDVVERLLSNIDLQD